MSLVYDDETEELSSEEITCYGCKHGILNQLGHMEKGDCLYVSEDLE